MNLQKLMKQAQAMQANMAQAQARLAEKEYTAETAGSVFQVSLCVCQLKNVSYCFFKNEVTSHYSSLTFRTP